MATRFEIVLYGGDPVRLRAAGEEALDEIDRLEAQLSLYRPESELSGVNARAADGPVPVTASLIRLLQTARELSAVTEGAFDATVAPLMRAWGFMGGTGRLPDPDALAAARRCVGMDLVELDEDAMTVRFLRSGVTLDLGSIGKGYAVERAALLLHENGIESALIHGGSSTLVAIGTPPREEAWCVALQHPTEPESHLGLAQLRDESLSVSAVHGKAFEAGGRRYGHVLDPRRGEPTDGPLLAAVVLPSATATDALSTALLVGGEAGLPLLARHWPEMRALLAVAGEGGVGGVRVATWNWGDEEMR